MSRTNNVNRAVGALMYKGCSVKRLAAEARYTPSAITLQLSGRRSIQPCTVDAMHHLIGADATIFVLDAIPKKQATA